MRPASRVSWARTYCELVEAQPERDEYYRIFTLARYLIACFCRFFAKHKVKQVAALLKPHQLVQEKYHWLACWRLRWVQLQKRHSGQFAEKFSFASWPLEVSWLCNRWHSRALWGWVRQWVGQWYWDWWVPSAQWWIPKFSSIEERNWSVTILRSQRPERRQTLISLLKVGSESNVEGYWNKQASPVQCQRPHLCLKPIHSAESARHRKRHSAQV